MSDNWTPAFPVAECRNHQEDPGMSLRDYFAGQALSGICVHAMRNCNWDKIARNAYDAADAMLYQRE